jgi:predicted HAD superfamily Cof-like phosphohydrolase
MKNPIENGELDLEVLDKILARRKSGHQQRVELMLDKIRSFGDLPPIPSAPTIGAGKMVLAQAKLVLEETLELLEACGIKVETGFGETLDRKDLHLTIDRELTNEDLPHIAKEIADVSVVTTGMFSEFGIADVPVLEEVDANNLAKFGPGGYLDENRKWRKPPNHPTPDIGQVLKNQGWANPEISHEQCDTANVPVSSSGNG